MSGSPRWRSRSTIWSSCGVARRRRRVGSPRSSVRPRDRADPRSDARGGRLGRVRRPRTGCGSPMSRRWRGRRSSPSEGPCRRPAGHARLLVDRGREGDGALAWSTARFVEVQARDAQLAPSPGTRSPCWKPGAGTHRRPNSGCARRERYCWPTEMCGGRQRSTASSATPWARKTDRRSYFGSSTHSMRRSRSRTRRAGSPQPAPSRPPAARGRCRAGRRDTGVEIAARSTAHCHAGAPPCWRGTRRRGHRTSRVPPPGSWKLQRRGSWRPSPDER